MVNGLLHHEICVTSSFPARANSSDLLGGRRAVKHCIPSIISLENAGHHFATKKTRRQCVQFSVHRHQGATPGTLLQLQAKPSMCTPGTKHVHSRHQACALQAPNMCTPDTTSLHFKHPMAEEGKILILPRDRFWGCMPCMLQETACSLVLVVHSLLLSHCLFLSLSLSLSLSLPFISCFKRIELLHLNMPTCTSIDRVKRCERESVPLYPSIIYIYTYVLIGLSLIFLVFVSLYLPFWLLPICQPAWPCLACLRTHVPLALLQFWLGQFGEWIYETLVHSLGNLEGENLFQL